MAPSIMRNLALYGTLAFTLAAVVWLQLREEPASDDVQLVSSRKTPTHGRAEKANRSTKQLPSENTPVEQLPDHAEEGVGNGKEIDLFGAHAWYVPPPLPKPVELEPPPKPTAPPVPFAYMGKMEDTPQGTLIFLSANNKLYSVAKGQVIDRVWRLDNEDANTLRLTYLPLNLPQTLSKAAKPTPRQNNDVPNE